LIAYIEIGMHVLLPQILELTTPWFVGAAQTGALFVLAALRKPKEVFDATIGRTK
jgi:hypothetical protein